MPRLGAVGRPFLLAFSQATSIALVAAATLLTSCGDPAPSRAATAPKADPGKDLGSYPARNVFVAIRARDEGPGRPARTREEALARAKQAATRIKSGASFGQVAAEMSDDPVSKSDEGFVGFLSDWTHDAPVVVAALAALPEGVVSDPVEMDTGFQVLEKLPRAKGKELEEKLLIPVWGWLLRWHDLVPTLDSTQTKDQAYAEAARAVARLRAGEEPQKVESSLPGALPFDASLRSTMPGYEGLAAKMAKATVGVWSEPIETHGGWAIVVRKAYHRAYVRHLLVTHDASSPPAPKNPRDTVEANKIALEALARIQADRSSWNAVVAEVSEEPSSKARNGFMGDVCSAESQGRRVAPELEEAIFSLAPGAISEVVESRYGFHVFWRLD